MSLMNFQGVQTFLPGLLDRQDILSTTCCSWLFLVLDREQRQSRVTKCKAFHVRNSNRCHSFYSPKQHAMYFTRGFPYVPMSHMVPTSLAGIYQRGSIKKGQGPSPFDPVRSTQSNENRRNSGRAAGANVSIILDHPYFVFFPPNH